jgi:hypothetical protein
MANEQMRPGQFTLWLLGYLDAKGASFSESDLEIVNSRLNATISGQVRDNLLGEGYPYPPGQDSGCIAKEEKTAGVYANASYPVKGIS